MDNPNSCDVSQNSSRTTSAAGFRINVPPRIQHSDGDIPPSLSPLDAFAAHSRRLAKELEETRKAGERRLSRLPAHIVTESLNQHQASRPQIFRSLSDSMEQTLSVAERLQLDNKPEILNPSYRPTSSHLTLGGVTKTNCLNLSKDDIAEEDEDPQSANPHHDSHPTDYFAPVGRSESPAPIHAVSSNQESKEQFSQRAKLDSSGFSQGMDSSTDMSSLVPPNAAFARARNYHESSDDDYTTSNSGSTFSRPRRLSSSSGVSMPASPASPYINSHERSTSNISTISLQSPDRKNGRSHLNFSRPRSPASSSMSASLPSRQQSKASQMSQPLSCQSEFSGSLKSFDELRPTTSSYIHPKFNPSRKQSNGKSVDHNSGTFSALDTHHFEWQEPMFPSTPPLPFPENGDGFRASPLSDQRPSHEASLGPVRNTQGPFSFDFASDRPRLADMDKRPASSQGVSSSESRDFILSLPRPSTSHLGSSQTPFPSAPPIPAENRSRSSRSNSTIRPTTARTTSNYQALSVDEHVAKAIDLHQHGDLKESTYHLRIAAKQEHATGMLLFALACRHGWGMRASPEEGVIWLRKAVDIAMKEVAEDESPDTDRPVADLGERKAHRAQFALGIYELGISHLQGWGIEQDKALALRCFEVAGSWGDTDALVEAGRCYQEGIGCKKDLRSAARLYRQAEAKGVSMVGNSWIHKDKYNDVNDDSGRTSRSAGKPPAEKTRSKSKTRSFFGRKKSVVV